MAILQFRRGGSLVGSLLASEMFFDETINTFKIGTDGSGAYVIVTKLNESNVGSLSLTGNISASNAYFTGNVDLDGDIFIGGNITLGAGGNDTIFVGAPLSGSLIPLSGSEYNLGSPTKTWNTVYADNLIATTISGSLIVSYTDLTNKPTLVSGSSQIDHNTTSNYVLNEHINHQSLNIYAGNGLSGGGNITTSRTLTLDTGSTHFTSGVKTKLNTENVLSSSAQLYTEFDLRYLNTAGEGIVSGSSQISYPLLSNIPANIVSGSSQVVYTQLSSIPGGIVSGSVQITPLLPTGTVSGSSQVVSILSSLNTYTSSNDTLNTAQNSRLTSLETATGSLATTYEEKASSTHTLISGSSQVNADTITNFDVNVLAYINSQAVLSGSGYLKNTTDTLTGDLTITGKITAQEFHTEFISSSIIYESGSTKFGDTGDDQHQFTGSVLISGSLGITNNALVTNLNSDLLDSQHGAYYLSYTNFTNLPTLVSGSSQVSYTGLSSIPAGIVSGSVQIVPLLPTGTISGSSQVSFTTIINKPTLVSGSSQISYVELSNIPENIVSGSSQLTSSYDTRYETRGRGILSGSSQVTPLLPTGTVSGSSQVDLTQTTNYVTGIKTRLNAETVISGSSQVSYVNVSNIPSGIISSSNQLTSVFLEIGGDNVVSGSSQVLYPALSNIPVGIVSGSSQIDHDQTTNFDPLEHFTSASLLLPSSQISDFSSSLSGKTNTSIYAPTLDYHPATKKYVDDVIVGAGGYNDEQAQDAVGNILTSSPTIEFNYNDATALISASVILGGISIPSSQITDFNSSVKTRLDAETVISGSSQISYPLLSNIPAGIVSGSSQLTSVFLEINGDNVISGSSQVVYTQLSSIPSGIVSGSSQVVSILSSLNTYTGSNDTLNTAQNSRLTSLETATGSLATTYEQKASGTHTLISGSSQVNADTITNFDANVLTYINSQAVISGSGYLKNTTDTLTGNLTVTGIITAQEFHTEFISSSIIYQSGSTKFGDTGDDQHQFTGSVLISGSLGITNNALVTNLNSDLLDSQHGAYYLSYTNFTNKPTLVSGSSQITYTGLTSIPSGIVSGSTQITPLLPTGTVSGSVQVVYTGLSSIPAGIISGSSQLNSTTIGSLTISTSATIGGATSQTSVNLAQQANAAVTTGGLRDIATITTTSKIGAHVDYGVVNGVNSRVGTIMIVWNGATQPVFSDNSTADMGDTSGVVFSVVYVNSTTVKLQATTTTSTWDIRTFVRTI
jgi:ethanolamine utilization microcompartment shell protein EutS